MRGWLELLTSAGLLVASTAWAARGSDGLGPLLGELVLPSTAHALAPPSQEPAESAEPGPEFPFLADEDPERSVSIGDTSHGRLVSAAELSTSTALGILPRQEARDLRYGSDELVAALETAATTLYAETSTRMWVGNVGAKSGGDIAWSVSHNSGRDADVAFCYQDGKGAPIDPPDLIALSDEGRAVEGPYRFDVRRTWIVVRALLLSQDAQVQYLFISHALKRKLLEHARAIGESGFVIERANVVLRQPGGAAPHNDHLHVRVYCSRRDVEGGCQDVGPIHPWIDTHGDARRDRIARSEAALTDPSPKQRKNAALRLALLASRDSLQAIEPLLADESDPVRAAAAKAIGELGTAGATKLLASRFQIEPAGDVRAALLRAAGELGGPSAGSLLAHAIETEVGPTRALRAMFVGPAPLAAHSTLLPLWWGGERAAQNLGGGIAHGPAVFADWATGAARPAEDRVVMLAAIEGATRANRIEPLVPLIDLLTHADPSLRQFASSAIRRVGNNSFPLEAEGDLESLEDSAGWHTLVAQLGLAGRGAYLVVGFSRAGYNVPSIDRRAVWELVQALGGPSHIAENAQVALQQIALGEGPDSLAWHPADACRSWVRFFEGRRKEYRTGLAPIEAKRVCWALRREQKEDDES